MTVARQLARLNPRIAICILESGQATPTTFSDGLRDLDSRGIAIKTTSRERDLGGSSSTWSGLCAPFDDIDLLDRSWVPNSGWPISGSTLLKYYERAAERYRLPAPSRFSPGWWDDIFDDGGVKPNWTLLETKMFVASTPPQRFGVEKLDFIDGTRIRLLLDSSVVRLEGNPVTNQITHAVVRNSEGRESFIRARIFVLACGGIENARLLLVSRF
jgi:hypothetical protein